MVEVDERLMLNRGESIDHMASFLFDLYFSLNRGESIDHMTGTTSTLSWILGEFILKPKRVLIHKNHAEAHGPKLMAI